MRIRMLYKILILLLVTSQSLFAGVKTCQEIARLLFKDPKATLVNDAPISWPKSILQEDRDRESQAQKYDDYMRKVPSGRFTGAGGLSIAYHVFQVPNERGAIVLLHGIKESGAIQLENIQTFIREGYSVYVMDHRGHGHSDRDTTNPQVVHTNGYNEYLSDVKTFMNTVVNTTPHDRVYMLGNSMGGLIATLYAEENPNALDGLIASVPAYRINLKGVPHWLTKAVLKLNKWIGRSHSYALTQGNFKKAEWAVDPVSGSANRMVDFFNTLNRFPMHRKGGVSNQWLASTLKANDKVNTQVLNLVTPALMLAAGKDNVVLSKAILEFAAKSPVSFSYYEAGALHGLLFETDDIRNPTLTEALRFLVNPIRLDSPPRANEMEKLITDSKRYLSHGQNAFAFYTMNEAMRVYEWKNHVVPEWQNEVFQNRLSTLLDTTQKKILNSPVGEQGLFMFLEYRRRLELEKLYP